MLGVEGGGESENCTWTIKTIKTVKYASIYT